MRYCRPLLGLLFLAGCTESGGPTVLRLYCGAGLQPAVAEIIAEFEEKGGARIDADFAGSNFLLGSIKVSRQGDLYLPGARFYIDLADKEGLIAEVKDVCFFVPVIFVAPGNPDGIKELRDLARPGIRLALGDSRSCAVGVVAEKILEKNGIPLEKVERNVVFRGLTVSALALQVPQGKIDATIIWDATARAFRGKGEIVPIPQTVNVVSEVAVGILKTTKELPRCRRFLDFISGKRGKEIFQRHGYTTADPRGK